MPSLPIARHENDKLSNCVQRGLYLGDVTALCPLPQALSRRQRCFVVRFRRSRASAPALTRSAPASSASRARSTRPFSAPRSAPLPIASRTRDSLPLPPGEVRLTAYRSSRTRRRRMIWVSTDLTERSSWVRRRRVNRGGPRTGGRPAFAGGTLAPGYFWNVSPAPSDA